MPPKAKRKKIIWNNNDCRAVACLRPEGNRYADVYSHGSLCLSQLMEAGGESVYVSSAYCIYFALGHKRTTP